MQANSPFEGLSCEQIFSLLSEYLDAELPEDVCEKLTGHIEDCAPCVEFVSSLRQSIALCNKFRPDELPAPLAEEARAKLRLAYEGMKGA